MKIIRMLVRYFTILYFFSLFACLDDVSRDNPLDPANGDANIKLSGQVLTFYHPRAAVSRASILMQPGNLVVITDEEGLFRFDNLEPGYYSLTCLAEDYQLDSVSFELSTSFEHTFLLNGLPQFENTLLETHHRSRWFPEEEIYFIEIETLVSDLDGIGDIKSVICYIPSIGFSDTLHAKIEAGVFFGTIYDSDLPVSSVHQLIGRQIYFIVEDDFGTKTTSEVQFITRIIEDTPTLVSPVELQSIDSFPINFKWERFSVPYPATFTIEIFQINLGIAFKIEEIQNILIANESYLYANNLNPGDYLWTINIVDEFGNSSSSREGTFQIK